ncbi:MAG: hypothetical protein A2487_07405 [Candidatus Raymondbacteria bacterium RifOxyC12_full_50_8]|uniref:Secretion system C-terminal sorting domain-containing protein n=1 Tax=Candidatus Raymondbacteria bacterium RIFOXYD12_FULL_49_13 TaxID=1817890 RepID=A0A1F7F9K6_UNCRA|nr:MAG: hypothetical protein A2350_06850 [Candidatus Raymondbacteria bacterium RifOxyB12_full_50_8]OGJ93208.1 MAG: hypothetical protein A2248_17710 [Candidatus Raymondbacteria bacterium RIFOXYA2_FULL_49_16]OGJ99427.1 MAG: hypothetical protein A2487_07405 [Candidatus Raymondbacteria bacterium RifOxyC12_full_50_8]OGK03291.1 MAG: hypothetical protein A2519_15055 [Candidatus Raymondbacteria bacterium RIFOXYD12_FULL_49_13]OGP44930.1 MAG: hypothetical protein A2324_19635 [Candidatus Raymondbacteria b
MIRLVFIMLCFVLAPNPARGDEALASVSTDTWGIVSGNKMVYMDYHYVTASTFWSEVAVVDIPSKQKTVLYPTDGRSYPYYLSYGFSGTDLAYVPYLSSGGTGGYAGGGTSYLYHKNISSGVSRQLITNSSWKEMVWVGGSIVTWIDYRFYDPATIDSVNSEIYYYNLGSSQEIRLTNSHAYQSHPCTDGQTIAWIDYTESYGRLFLHTIATAETREIAAYAAHKDNPRLDGAYVVWEDYRNAGTDPKNGDIYYYNTSTNTTHAACTAPGYQGNIFIDSNRIVWEDYRNAGSTDQTNADIYSYDIPGGNETPLVVAPGYQAHPTLAGDTLCWMDNAAGQMRLLMKILPPVTTEQARFSSGNSNPTPYLSGNSGVWVANAPRSPLTVQVYDVNGRIVAHSENSGSFAGSSVMPLNQRLSAGVYVLVLRTSKGMTAHKAVAW